MIKLFFPSAFLFSINVYALPKYITSDAVKEMSFKRCIDINYSELNIFYQSRVDDYSYFWVKVAIDEDTKEKTQALDNSIRRKTAHYYLISSADNTENEENNGVLALCMDFYHSPDLANYIEQNIFQD